MDSHYILDQEFALIKASAKEFAIHYTTYRENVFFRQSWDRRIAIFGKDFTRPVREWIKLDIQAKTQWNNRDQHLKITSNIMERVS